MRDTALIEGVLRLRASGMSLSAAISQAVSRPVEVEAEPSAFADFSGEPTVTAGSPLKVPVPADAPLQREWILVCAAPDYPACVAGWEFAGQTRAADADRQFEVLWTVDPQGVRDAAAICAQLAESFSPRLGRLLSDLLGGLLADPPPPASANLRRAMGLLNRMTSYIERATPRG